MIHSSRPLGAANNRSANKSCFPSNAQPLRPIVRGAQHLQQQQARQAPLVAMATAVKELPTQPIEGQKTGTSGLRKKTNVFMGPNYLANWVQSLFNALGAEIKGKTLCLGGDGRYFGKEASQIIIKLAAGNGFSKVVVGQDAIMATPAMSALIRRKKHYGEAQVYRFYTKEPSVRAHDC
ncbi:hypothetical protein DUNSADRAFT_11536 [Dunaliella salina]|uniref:Alpha-D-phosphohexomutase alpha/beta/alpha domain-containing protein n=1 Tax=Dunaliella salina TaxID=3046 RepID=A0ABZ3KTP4_DUNSA|nr:hypothetical protein DUNSADRAFT_11536 [Dunaliella salina]|eukprot:KAF5832542.1 hypothetical protein DUNSADRAFT_11536 [Dunaliella salina]